MRTALLTLLLTSFAALAQVPAGGTLLASSSVAATSAGCSTNTDSELITQTAQNSGYQLAGNNWRSQGFYLSGSASVTEIVLKLRDDGSDAGSATISLYSDNSGKPGSEISGTVVSVPATSIAAGTYNEVTFTLTNSVTLSGTNHLVFRCTSGATLTFQFYDGNVYSSGPYNYSSNAGSSWTTYAADLYFRLFGCTQ